MAVETTNAFSGPFIPNGAATTFPFTFTAPSAAEVSVMFRAADGTEVAATGFAVNLTTGGGGSVVFDVAPAAGPELYILLDPHFTQQIQFENGSGWLAEPVNEVADRGAARDQVLQRDLGRSMRVPLGEDAPVLDPATVRANKFQAWGPTGKPISSHGTGADQGLRSDLGDESLGDALLKGASGELLRDENAARGTFVAGRTSAAKIELAPGKRHVGGGRADPIIMANETGGVEIPQPVGGDYNYHSLTENMFVGYDPFEECDDYANEVHYSAYGLSLNNTWWGGQIAAQRVRASVGHLSIGDEVARSKVGHLFEKVNIGGDVQSTVQAYLGGTTELVDAAIKADLRLDFLAFKARAFDKFNKLFADNVAFTNASFDAGWFEEYGPGTVTFTEAGGRVTGLAFNGGAGGGVLDLGKAIGPRFASCTFAGQLTISKGYCPVFESPLLVGGNFHVFSDGIARDAFHMKHARVPNSGAIALQSVSLTLPQYGETGTLLEHYGVSASHTSMAIAELAGVGLATGMGHANLYSSELDGGAWVFKTATVTGGQADPWGGASAFEFSGAAGQHYGNFFIPELSGGGKCCMQILLRAQAADSRIKLRIESTGANAWKRHNTYHFTDTRWRIVTLRADCPADGDFTTYIEYVAGDFDIAAMQLTLGYDSPPILRGGQSVAGAFTQIDRRIVKRGNAIPVAGKWWAGDEIVYDAATANTRKRRGAICTVGDGSGVGTWVEYGFVANMGSAIPDIGGAPSQADHNAVLAALRAAGIIAP